MSTRLQGLRTVIYAAPDLESAKRWWSDFVGTAPYFDEPYYVGFNPGGYELGLVPDVDPAEGALVYWGVADVVAAVSEACGLSAIEHIAPSDVGGGIITASVRTPDGNVVGFIHNPHFVLA